MVYSGYMYVRYNLGGVLNLWTNNFPLPTILTAHFYLQQQGIGWGERMGSCCYSQYISSYSSFHTYDQGQALTQAQPNQYSRHLELVERERKRLTDKQTIILRGWPCKGSHDSCCMDLRSSRTPSSR